MDPWFRYEGWHGDFLEPILRARQCEPGFFQHACQQYYFVNDSLYNLLSMVVNLPARVDREATHAIESSVHAMGGSSTDAFLATRMFALGSLALNPEARIGATVAEALPRAATLVHLTSASAAESIREGGLLSGRFGLYALDANRVPEGEFMRSVSTLVPRDLSQSITIDSAAAQAFHPPEVLGPFSFFRNVLGHQSVGIGTLDLRTGEFLAGRVLPTEAYGRPYSEALEQLRSATPRELRDWAVHEGFLHAIDQVSRAAHAGVVDAALQDRVRFESSAAAPTASSSAGHDPNQSLAPSPGWAANVCFDPSQQVLSPPPACFAPSAQDQPSGQPFIGPPAPDAAAAQPFIGPPNITPVGDPAFLQYSSQIGGPDPSWNSNPMPDFSAPGFANPMPDFSAPGFANPMPDFSAPGFANPMPDFSAPGFANPMPDFSGPAFTNPAPFDMGPPPMPPTPNGMP